MVRSEVDLRSDGLGVAGVVGDRDTVASGGGGPSMAFSVAGGEPGERDGQLE